MFFQTPIIWNRVYIISILLNHKRGFSFTELSYLHSVLSRHLVSLSSLSYKKKKGFLDHVHHFFFGYVTAFEIIMADPVKQEVIEDFR